MPELKNIVKELKNVSGGENGISTKVFKDVIDFAANRMLDIINTSLTYGVFPENWKCSMVVPVPKVSNTHICSEFRPINNVSVYEKVLEMVVKTQIEKHCNANGIIVGNQSGFRQGHPCETVIVNVCDAFRKALDRGCYVLVVLLDFSRAFETINRDILIKKLASLGFGGVVLRWFKSYLSNRTQVLKFKNCMSDALAVEHGVPQGTVLGPLLFLLYKNDIVEAVSYSNIELFADDTMIYMSGTNINELENFINYDISKLYEWLCKNSLSVNVKKSNYCIFGKKSLISKIDVNNVSINIGGEKVTYKKQVKYLIVI